MTSVKPKRFRGTPGTIISIPLSDGWLAFARILKDCSIRVYKCRSKRVLPVDVILSQPIYREFSTVSTLVTNGRWAIVARCKFADAADAEPLPTWNRSMAKVYFKGEFRDPADDLDPNSLYEQIMYSGGAIEKMLTVDMKRLDIVSLPADS